VSIIDTVAIELRFVSRQDITMQPANTSPASWFRKTRFTRGRVWELKNTHNSVTVQNRKHAYMNFFDHKNLGNDHMQ
jgi:hypothetical protein